MAGGYDGSSIDLMSTLKLVDDASFETRSNVSCLFSKVHLSKLCSFLPHSYPSHQNHTAWLDWMTTPTCWLEEKGVFMRIQI